MGLLRERALVMPKLRGLETIYAFGELEDADITWVEDHEPTGVFHDLSFMHREVDDPWEWKVWSTIPKAGTELAPGERITVFALKKREFSFFRKHPRMPKAGWKFQQEVDGLWGGWMAGVESFIEARYVPELAPGDALRWPDHYPPPTSGLPPRREESGGLQDEAARGRQAIGSTGR